MAFEDVKENPFKYLKTIFLDLLIAAVAFGYIFYQMLSFEITTLNPLIILAQSAMGIFCGILMKQGLGEVGFMKGLESPKWLDEEEMYQVECAKAMPYMNKVDNFYSSIDMEKKMHFRISKLQSVCLRYIDWFDKRGNFIGDPLYTKSKKLTRKQKNALKSCLSVKIYPLDLFSEFTVSVDKARKKEPTIKSKRNSNIASNSVFSSIIAVIGVYFIPVLTLNGAAAISATMQVLLWMVFGMIQLYKNYSFVVFDRVSILKEKKKLINRFISECNLGMHCYDPYDETKVIKGEIPLVPVEVKKVIENASDNNSNT